MRVCKVCGGGIDAETIICPHCGCAVPRDLGADRSNEWLALLAVIVPTAGLVLWAVHRKKYPNRARNYAVAAILGCVLEMVLAWLGGLL